MTLYEAIATRRDVRNEFRGDVIEEEVLLRLLRAAHAAPSVGHTRPWDFVVVRAPATLTRFAAHVAGCREDFARSLPPDRAETFGPIVIDGIEQSGTGIVVTYDPSRGGSHVLGRRTIDETGRLSVALAIENLWLAATAEGIGVGWVSFYHKAFLRELLSIPDDIEPIAWLCVGPVTQFRGVPDLEHFGWRAGRPLEAAVHRETYRTPSEAASGEQ
ncbi:5,6-dimethylbenzimidazole synthase [Gordonia sp. OPL2]|nr:5,6-dimethylbenzimidazole synthase [Gordonia sp. OPL2]